MLGETGRLNVALMSVWGASTERLKIMSVT